MGRVSGTGGAQYGINFFVAQVFQSVYLVHPVNPANPFKKSNLLLATTLLLVCSFDLVAQNGVHNTDVLRDWIALDAPPGWEHVATDSIMRAMPGWKRDVLGNLVLRKGSGSPRRVVACGLDRPGFAVTEITDDGYLRLREAGAGRQHPLWVQFHEGQRIRVLTRAGAVPGVVIVKSTHLQGGRVANAPVATLNDLWVDVGAASKAEVQRLGIEMLNPVVRDVAGWSYGEFVAGPMAGLRVGCAAVASAAQGEVRNGETIFLITTLRSFGHDGFEAALRALGRVDGVTLVDAGEETERKVEKPAYLPESTGLTSITVLSPRVRFAGSLVESVNVSDASKLLTAVATAANVSNPSWAPVGAALRGRPFDNQHDGLPQRATPYNCFRA
ncbi:MAG TPA: hypothetical protein VKB05_02405 [Pyrinomonadaceae bacterium]|nr:hypothetical protein [Pyrinomonadaceae bacterium]